MTVKVIKQYNPAKNRTEYLVNGDVYVSTEQDTTKEVHHPADDSAARLIAMHFPKAKEITIERVGDIS